MVTPVRPLAKGDMAAVIAIEAEANPMPWREGDFHPFVQPAPISTPMGNFGGLSHGWPRGGAAVKMAWVWDGKVSGADTRPNGAVGAVSLPGSGIQGFACAAAVLDEVELQSIAVRSEARGRGVGSALLEALVDWAREEGYRSLHLEVRAGNVPALALYRRFGFSQVGSRRGYYQDNGEDALLLSREI